MELLNHEEIKCIVQQCGHFDILEFTVSNYSDTLIGYLAEHLRLTVRVQANGIQSELKFFMKCMPKDKWIAEFLKESNFFRKEYVMLSQLFEQFEHCEGEYRWRPRSLLIREDLFVFEDVKELGYKMANQVGTMNYKEIMATVRTLARFHAQSFIYEENKSLELQKPYRIWDDFGDNLQEPNNNKDWRDAGRNAAIDFLIVNSKHKFEANFAENIREVFYSLFNDAFNLMRPSSKYRNTVIHRDLWSNNILLNAENEKYHALIVDFQTVLYCPPTMDLSSLIYFNTTKSFRCAHVHDILDFYYEVLSAVVENEVDVEFSTILSKPDFVESFNESLRFGMTQAAIIVPIIAMGVDRREQLFCDPESIHRINNVSRSVEIMDIAQTDAAYRARLTELFEDIVEKYYFDK